MRVLILGCGYVGNALGTELVRQGHEVFGLRRNWRAEAVEGSRVRRLVADVCRLDQLAALPREWDWVVYCVSSAGGGLADYVSVYLQGMHNVIQWLLPASPKKLVYTSSTSVYGQTDGSVVTEKSAAEPATDTGRTLVQTENVLLDSARQNGFPGVVLRVAGIYGPGRGYWFRQFLSGTAIIEGSGQRLLNMIHRDDVAGAVLAALQGGQPGEVYNAVDDEPLTQLAFFQWLSSSLGKPMPSFGPEDTATALKRGLTSKRVSNFRLKSELAYRFKYPTFREGYTEELATWRQQQSGWPDPSAQR